MSAPAVSHEVPRGAVTSAAFSIPSRLVAAFSGPVGFGVKIVLLSVVNATGVYSFVILAHRGQWKAAVAVVAVTAIIDAIYLSPRAVPAKFLLPGTFFLICFQVIPVLYTVDVAFTNYSTGHILGKASAIEQIKLVTLAETGNGKTFTMTPARAANGKLVLLLVDDQNGKSYVGTSKELTPTPKSDFAKFKVLTGAALIAASADLGKLVVPSGGDNGIRAEGLSTAVELHPTLRYDARTDTFTRVGTGEVFRDNGRGSFVHGSQPR